MARKNRTPEENARREKIRELLQMANIGSMDDIQNLFKETIAEFMENGLEAELDDELGYSRYDYRNKSTDNSRNGHSSKTLRTSFGDVEVSIAHHVEVAVAEQVKAVAVDRRVGEFVLAEHVDGLVGDDRAGEQQAVLCPRAQPVQRPARGDVVGLDLVALVADDAVRLPRGQFLLQAPRGFVVHHQYLQGAPFMWRMVSALRVPLPESTARL